MADEYAGRKARAPMPECTAPGRDERERLTAVPVESARARRSGSVGSAVACGGDNRRTTRSASVRSRRRCRSRITSSLPAPFGAGRCSIWPGEPCRGRRLRTTLFCRAERDCCVGAHTSRNGSTLSWPARLAFLRRSWPMPVILVILVAQSGTELDQRRSWRWTLIVLALTASATSAATSACRGRRSSSAGPPCGHSRSPVPGRGRAADRRRTVLQRRSPGTSHFTWHDDEGARRTTWCGEY